MKKRDLKAYGKEVRKFTLDSMDTKKNRAAKNDVGKVNMPYKMLQGMRNKSVDRLKKRESNDKNERIIGDSGRNTKLMQNYFEVKEHDRREAKRLRLDTSNRGVNMHVNSIAKYKSGALHINKDSRHRLERGDFS